jgi:hypothetical protein
MNLTSVEDSWVTALIGGQTLEILDIIVSFTGWVSVFACAWVYKYKLLFCSACAVIIACVHSTLDLEQNSETTVDIFILIDTIAAIILTFICGLYMNLHKTCLGVLRILWLIVLITTSSSYTIFSMNTYNVLPNDLTVIAISSTLILFIMLTGLIKMYRRNRNSEEEPKHGLQIFAEYSLICGALVLRFEEDLFGDSDQYSKGRTVWHFCAWVSILAISMLRDSE